MSSGEQHVPRPPSYILGASTTTATVCVPVGKAHSTELAAAGGAGATGTTALGPVAAAQDEDDAANSEEDAAGDGGGRPRRGKQPTRKKPGQRSGHLEVRLDWYAQAAVVCQPATCIDTTTDYGSEAAGGGEGVEGGGGSAGAAGASRGAGARSRRPGGRVARLCHVREGRLEELSTAAERGVRRGGWRTQGIVYRLRGQSAGAVASMWTPCLASVLAVGGVEGKGAPNTASYMWARVSGAHLGCCLAELAVRVRCFATA